MNRTLAIVALAIAMIFALAMTATVWPEYRAQIAANTAVLTAKYGSVTVRHGTSGWTNASVNTVLKSGDAIRTGKDSRAELTVHGSGYVRLDANTHLLIRYIDDKKGSSLKALVGGVWVSIERALVGASGFKLEMPSAVAAVKGTIFRCVVDEAGNCETAVYDGEVSCEADGKQFAVTPGRCFARRRAFAAAVRDMNLDEDAAHDWVVWNRRKDLINMLGNPRIVIAAAEHNGTGRQVTPAGQARLAERLMRAGFNVAVVPENEVPDSPIALALSPGSKGVGACALLERLSGVNVRRPGEAAGDGRRLGGVGNGDIVIAAEFFASCAEPIGQAPTAPPQTGHAAPRAVGGGATGPPRQLYGSRSSGKGMILDPKSGKALYQWDARRSGQGDDEKAAGCQALENLGDRFGDELVRQLLDTLMVQKQMVHIKLQGVRSRQELFGFMARLRKHPRVRRALPHKYQSGFAVMGVATDLSPPEVAAWITKCTNGTVSVVAVNGPVISAQAAALQPAQPQRPKQVKPDAKQGKLPQAQKRPLTAKEKEHLRRVYRTRRAR